MGKAGKNEKNSEFLFFLKIEDLVVPLYAPAPNI